MTQHFDHAAPTELLLRFNDATINIALLTELRLCEGYGKR
jgi:hypothetical protein